MRPHRMILHFSLGFLLLHLAALPGSSWASGAEPAKAARPSAGEKPRSVPIEVPDAEPAKKTAEAAELIRQGWLLLEKGDYDNTISFFEQALQLNPRSSEAKTGKGSALGRKGDLKAAEMILKEALAHNPNPVRVHYELGLVYDQLGEPDKALFQYKFAVEKHRQGRR